MATYYIYKDTFGELKYPPLDEKLPRDIKRLISFGNHQFLTSGYFVSAENKSVYKQAYGSYYIELSQSPISSRSNKVNVIDDNDKRTSLTLSDKFFERIKDMNPLNIPLQNRRGGAPSALNIYASIIETE